MASNTIVFDNYILGKIIKSIHFDPINNDIRLDEISVSEDEIEEIVKEGERLNLSRKQVIDRVQVLSENISFNPGIDSDFSSVDIDKIECGKYLRVFFNIDDVGRHFIDLIYLYNNHFFVLDSTIGCVQYSDILESTNKLWHPSYSVDFIVKRNNIRFPNSKSYLRIGKIESVDWYTPAYVYQIINTKADHQDEKKNLNPVKEVLSKIKASRKAGTLSDDYYSILGSWILLGGNSYTLSLIFKKEISLEEERASKSRDLSFFYETLAIVSKIPGHDDAIPVGPIKRSKWQWIIFILISIISTIVLGNLSMDNTELSEKNKEFELTNKALKDSISDIYSYFNNICKIENATGAPTKLSSTLKDNGWGMWVYANSPLIIKSFDVLADNSGFIRIGLYNSSGSLLDERDIEVSAGSFVTASPSFKLRSKGYYYLCITQANSNRLSYHSSSSKEYETYVGHLKVTGCCSKEKMSTSSYRTNTSYYQYFYNIKYELLY